MRRAVHSLAERGLVEATAEDIARSEFWPLFGFRSMLECRLALSPEETLEWTRASDRWLSAVEGRIGGS